MSPLKRWEIGRQLPGDSSTIKVGRSQNGKIPIVTFILFPLKEYKWDTLIHYHYQWFCFVLHLPLISLVDEIEET